MAMNQLGENIPSSLEFDKNPVELADYSNSDWRLKHSQDCMKEKSDKVSDEVLDLLPCDPFGMDIDTTHTKFSGSLEGIRHDLASSLPCDPFGMNLGTTFGGWLEGIGDDLGTLDVAKGEDQLSAEVNFVWDDSFLSKINDLMSQHERFLAGLREGGIEFHHEGSLVCTADDSDTYADIVEGSGPHDGLLFALNYLGVKDLFSVERVCKSLRDAVRYDRLLWKRICIYHPLSTSLDDNTLLQLTDRAQGALECLVLVECRKITDSGLGHVLQRNPRLSKLCVPRCGKLTIEGILSNLRTLRSMGKLGLKELSISGLTGGTKEHFEQLMSLLGADSPNQSRAHKPHLYGFGTLNLSCEDDNRIIDIEKCPTCDRYRQVYDCTLESCSNASPPCRGCTRCIPRCIYCGRCIRGLDYVETFHFDLACFPCFRKHLSARYMEENSGDCIIVQKWESCHVQLHG